MLIRFRFLSGASKSARNNRATNIDFHVWSDLHQVQKSAIEFGANNAAQKVL